MMVTKNITKHIGPDNADIFSSLTNCITNICYKYFETDNSIWVYYSKESSDEIKHLVRYLQSTLKWTVCIENIIINAKLKSNVMPKSMNYIVFISSLEQLQLFLMKTTISSSKRNSIFLFVILHNASNVEHIFQTVYKFRVLNPILLVNNISNPEFHNLYTWYPYSPINCGNNFNDTNIINTCINGMLSSEKYIFPNTVIKNLYGCTIKARPVAIPPFVFYPENKISKLGAIHFTKGIEISMLNTIAEATNFNINYSISQKEMDWGYIIENSNLSLNVSGLMKALITKEVDIGIGCIGSTPIRYKYLDQSVSYVHDALNWCVPRAQLQAKWKCIFTIFKASTWSLIALTILCSTLILWQISSLNEQEVAAYRNVNNCLFNILSVLLNITVTFQPNRTFTRIFFCIWVIFSLHITLCYQTYLVSLLTSPIYEKQIMTVEQIFQKKLAFGFVPSAARYFENRDDWRIAKLYDEVSFCTNATICMENVAYNRNYSFAFSLLYLKYNYKLLTQNDLPLVYIFKEREVTYPVQMFTSKNFILTPRINELSLKIKEAGLINFWFHQLLNEQNQKSSNIETSTMVQNLSLHHLQGAFVLLCFGICISMFTFLLELCINMYMAKPNSS